MKILSFNVNGIRAIVKKTFVSDMLLINPDIICLQETKATVEQVKDAVNSMSEYVVFGNEANKKGYSGTAILSKYKPLKISYGIGIERHDQEGRVVQLEFDNFHLVNVYVPNSGSELLRLDYRQEWDKDFCDFLKKLEETKPVVVCGDFNVAHKDIDLARPKQNYNKAAGYMQTEIDGYNRFMEKGFIDIYRTLNPNEIKYTWWSYRAGARNKNIGWRIDYFLVSNSILSNCNNVEIMNNVYGSDHCPVLLSLEVFS